MENKFGLKDSLLKKIIDLAKQHNVKRLVLFGSRARGDFKRKSDIDLAVLGENISRFASDVDEMTDTLLKYDIVYLSYKLSHELLKNIENEGIILYEKI